jgi:hypothetical protein
MQSITYGEKRGLIGGNEEMLISHIYVWYLIITFIHFNVS